MAGLYDLISFNGSNGLGPNARLIADANGNLFGTTTGIANGGGSVFEIAKTATGYASTPTVLVSFGGVIGAGLWGSLILDANGNLFGTAETGGDYGDGTVFEIVNTPTGYATAPTILLSFDGANGAYPHAGLILDGYGNLFGTTEGDGINNDGTVFEIPRAATATGYADSPVTLASFDAAAATGLWGALAIDASGNLFGTTAVGGTDGGGTVFEIAKTASGYAATPTTLVNFDGSNGAVPWGGLILDAAGNLFGTTEKGGANEYGTVFEIAKTASGYASAPTVLVSFDGIDGMYPRAGLIADANGNLFGTTAGDGTNSNGTLFEIAKTSGGYAGTAKLLVSFDGMNGASPSASLLVDAAGRLFGTTLAGGANGLGTVFEATAFRTPNDFAGNGTSDILLRDPASGNLSQFVMHDGQPTFAYIGIADPHLRVVGVGDCNADGTSDILFRDPASGNLSQFVMHNGQPSFAYIGMADPHLQVVGVGDCNADGTSDILFRDLASGNLSQFVMHNGQPSFAYIGMADPHLQVVGIGDFNGDGTADILFRDPTSGNLSDFIMRNGQPTWSAIGWANPALQVAAIGDYNADGTADILLRDPAGGGLSMFAMHANQPTWAAIGWAAPGLNITG